MMILSQKKKSICKTRFYVLSALSGFGDFKISNTRSFTSRNLPSSREKQTHRHISIIKLSRVYSAER